MTIIRTAIEAGKKHRKIIIIISAILIWLLWLIGQIFRDSSWISSLLFYIPSPVLFLLLLGVSSYAWRARYRPVALLLATLAIAPATFVIHVENNFRAQKQNVAPAKTLRLLHWNVASAHFGWQGTQKILQQTKADIYILSEVKKKTDMQATAKAFGPDYSAIQFSRLAVVARGAFQSHKWLLRGDAIKAHGVVWQSPQGKLRVLVIDLNSNLLIPREARLQAVTKIMIDWKADIIVGDFNAPRQSRALSPLPPGFIHAYDAAGSSISYTWPLPCPVYAIDQCILSARIQPINYTLRSSWRSDHRQQVLDFSVHRQVKKGASENLEKIRLPQD